MSNARKIILIRHGALASAYDGCHIGSSDLPLGEDGIAEAKAVGRFLKSMNPGLILASPLLRARQTAELAFPGLPVIYDDILREIDFGAWEKLTFDQICGQFPEMIEPWRRRDRNFTFPGGENIGCFYDRAEQLKQRLLLAESEVVAIVSHGGVILNLLSSVLDIAPQKICGLKVERGSVSTVDLFENGAGILTLLNFKPDLEGALWPRSF